MSHPCSAPSHGDDLPLDQAGLDRDEQQILTVMRFFFQSFTHPESQGWMKSFRTAHDHFPQDQAARLAVACLAVIQAMRCTRNAGFRFSNPDCAHCARILSRDERQLLGALAATRRGQRSRAHTHALLLCEGNDTQPFLSAINDLSQLMAQALNARDRVAFPSA